MLNAAVVRGPVVLRRGANLSASRRRTSFVAPEGGGGCAGDAALADAEALANAKVLPY